jgi:hypothetical protein
MTISAQHQATSSFLTPDQIEEVVNALPPQGRIMLRLLLLQYLDVTQEDCAYMAADRPDPRFHAGGKPLTSYISQETIQGLMDRVTHYRTQLRQRRERTSLQIECLTKQIAVTEALCTLAEQLLLTRFSMAQEAVQDLKQHARAAVPKPALRELERKWEQNAITEDGYRQERLCLEWQMLLRKLDREQKRLALAQRELHTANSLSLQDHEIAHVWGIPAGALSARKAKYLHQYLQAIQGKLQQSRLAAEQATTPPTDIWKETFVVLSKRPIQRSAALYDGLEGSETALLDKLTAFATGRLPEDIEGRFWLSINQDVRHGAESGSRPHSLFALQRLLTILGEMETAPDTLEQDLLARISPVPKVISGTPEEEAARQEAQLGEMGEHVLRSFLGESHPDTHGRR